MNRNALWLAIIFSVSMFVFVSMSMRADAGMPSGKACSSCHTMHNSQNNTFQAVGNTSGGFRVSGPGAGAQGLDPECNGCHADLRPNGLLKFDCIGCHAQDPNGANNIIDGIPQVAHSAGSLATGSGDLAGGNFRHVFGATFTNDQKGHNVHGFGANIGIDGNMSGGTPGDSGLVFAGSGATPGLMCAGANGCHGNTTIASVTDSISGAHHTVDTVLQNGSITEGSQGGTVGLSYRFLLGVKGGEDPYWEAPANLTSTAHNEYKGTDWAGRSSAQGTISQLCARCHGDFHASGATGIGGGGSGTSPWVRHPIDITMALGSVGNDFSAYSSYMNQTPVARMSIPANPIDNPTNTSERVVMCLSCHRPHGAPYPDSLRWAYDATMSTGGAGQKGCYNCHNGKL